MAADPRTNTVQYRRTNLHEHEFNQPHQQQCKWLCAAQQLWLLN